MCARSCHGPICIAASDSFDKIEVVAHAARLLPIETREGANYERDFDERDDQAGQAPVAGGGGYHQVMEAIIQLRYST